MTAESITELFTLGEYEFGIEKEECVIDIEKDHIRELRIVGSKVNFDKLKASKNFIFDWSEYPPQFYANEISLGRKNHINIDQSKGYEHDSALYIGDHFDLKINLSVHPEWILVAGFATIDKEQYSLIIRMKKK